MGEVSKEEIDKGIAKIYKAVLETKNISAKYIIILALASLWVDAYDFAAFTFGIAPFKNTFPTMSAAEFGFAVAAVQIGATVGAFTGGWLNDRIGRRNMFILNMILFTLMAVGAGLSTSPIMFSVFRTLLGYALGADTATGFAYIFEYLEKNQRLFWSNLWQLQWYIMYLVTIAFVVVPFYFVTGNITDPILWRIIMFVGAGLSFIILLLRSRIPESVLWLAYQGKLATAKSILKKTYGIELNDVPDVDMEYRKVARDWRSLFSIYKKEKWRELVYCFNGNFEQSFEFYSFGFYFPYIITTLGLAGPLANIEGNAVYYSLGVIGGVATAYLTPKIGTKSQYVIGAFGAGISMILLGITLLLKLPFSLFVAWAGAFYFFHVIGPASQGMTSINAFFPAHQRGTAAGWGYFWVKLAASIGSFWAPIMFALVGVPNLTIILGIYAILTSLIGIVLGKDARTYKIPEYEVIEEKIKG